MKAFHLVPSRKTMDRIIAHGAILPGAMRLDPDLFLEKCRLEFMELADIASIDEPKVKLNLTVLSSLEDLARDSIEELRRSQRESGVTGTQRTTQYACPDLLAGDLERVFLSLESWPSWVKHVSEESEPHGFVFNAEELVRKGARVRPRDLLRKYRWALEDALRSKVKSRGDAYAEALRRISRVQREGEFRGKSALAFLVSDEMYRQREEARESGVTMELVWDGPLSLELAVNVRPETLA
jgi:hypothetical protein